MMKVIEWVPTACRGKSAKFEGTVKVRLPMQPERYEIINEVGLKFTAEGEVDLAPNDTMMAMAKLIRKAQGFVEEVKITKKAGKESYGSFEDLLYDSDCDEINQEIGMQLIGGFKPSKN